MKTLNKELLEDALMQNLVSYVTDYENMFMTNKGSTGRLQVIDNGIQEIAESTTCATSRASLLAMIWYYSKHTLGENATIDAKYKMMSKNSPVKNVIDVFLDKKGNECSCYYENIFTRSKRCNNASIL